MKVKDMKSIIQDLDDDVDIEVNSVWDDECLQARANTFFYTFKY